MKVNSFNVGRMRQQEAFEFYNRVIKAAKICSVEDFVPVRKKLIDANEEFDIALKPIRKSLDTATITQEDENRDRAWGALSSAVRYGLKHYDPEVKEIARKADIIVKTYGNPTKLPYSEETGALKNLITDLKQKMFPEEREKLGIEGWLTELDRANKAFSIQQDNRQNQMAYLESGKSKEKRKLVDEAYKTMVEYINAYVVIKSSEDMIDCIVHINHLIDEENAILKARTSRNSKDGEES